MSSKMKKKKKKKEEGEEEAEAEVEAETPLYQGLRLKETISTPYTVRSSTLSSSRNCSLTSSVLNSLILAQNIYSST